MSDITEPATVVENSEATENESEASTIALQDRGAFTLNLESIDEGKWKGFKFFVPKFKSLEGATEHFTKLSKNGKDGDEVVLALLNSALQARMRSKANSLLTFNRQGKTKEQENAFYAERAEWLASAEKSILVSADEASEYVPGERETTSLSGLLKQKTELMKSIKAFKDKGEIDKAREQKDKYLEVSALIVKMQTEQDEETLAALDN